MRILHVITSLLTGGAEKLVVDLTLKLREMGHMVDVVVFNGADGPFLQEMERREEVRLYILGHSFYDFRYIWKLRKIMRNYDIIHTHNSSPQLYAAVANIGLHKRLVTTEHNTENRKRSLLFLRILDKWMYGKYDFIICISPSSENNLCNYLGEKWMKRLKKNNIATISNGIDVKRFQQAFPAIERDGEVVIVMVAAFRQQKDHTTLLRAMTYLPEAYVLWLVGDGELRPKVEAEIKELNLLDRVHLFGNRKDVPELLKSSDIVVLSSNWEGFGLAAVEGMAAGKPVVASDVDGLKQIVEGYGIVFPHGDTVALAHILKHLSTNRNYYNEVAEKCYHRANEYDLGKMVKMYNDMYNSLC